MKKFRFLIAILSLFLAVSGVKLWASECSEKVRESVTENGLTIFTLEDYSNPLVRVEVCVRAGFSYQEAYNAGFFELLSRLIQKSSRTYFNDVQCNSDSIRFILNVSPSSLEDTLRNISDDILNPYFSDSLLSSELAVMKREVLQTNGELGSIINASIDARVFSENPWKHDSGIYPALFSKINEDNARTILTEIQEKYFIPQNTAVFISGNIHSQETIDFISNSFGAFYSNRKLTHSIMKPGLNSGKKFVLHHKDFSPELTQLVVQYTPFDADICELAAAVYNDDWSKMKTVLSRAEELNIPGNEYINIASAYKAGCSRLIIQSLLQNVKNLSPVQQTENFVKILEQNISVSEEEYINALSKRDASYKKITDTSSGFMETLSEFWAEKPFYSAILEQSSDEVKSPSAYGMQARNDSFSQISPYMIENSFSGKEPFVFVILSTAQYNKYKKEFAASGFEEITQKNSSWYTQSLYKNLKTLKDLQSLSQNRNLAASLQVKDFTQDFYDSSKESIYKTVLGNNIPLYVKENPVTSGVTVVLSVSGGNLRSSSNHGFEEVMVNILTLKIMRQLQSRFLYHQLISDFEIRSETGISSSNIIVECDPQDLSSVMNGIITAMVLSEIVPSDADRIVQGRRTRKRLENGSMINQLYSAAVNYTLAGSPYANIFETQNEILSKTSYEEILQAYPQLLDASRYALIVSGNVDHLQVEEYFKRTFSILQNHQEIQFSEIEDEIKNYAFDFPEGRVQKVKITHTFLTDVSADKAGPMPAVLVPTKSFADPVLYCIKAPEFGTEDFYIFNSVLPYFQEVLNQKAEGKSDLYNCNINCANATVHIPMATVSFSAVDRTSAADSVVKDSISLLKEQLSGSGTSARILRAVKDRWVFSEFENAGTNTGSAMLIDKSLHEKLSDNTETFYLENYKFVNGLNSEQILSVVEKYFDFDKLYRVYSADSKK